MSQSDSAVPTAEPLLTVQNLTKEFTIKKSFLRRSKETIKAVDDVSFSINRGETYGLVGESGCGKTTTGRSILRLLEPTEGTVTIDGTSITDLSAKELQQWRKDIQIVFQDPAASLNPRMRIKDIIKAPLDIHSIGTKQEREERVRELIGMVDLPEEYLYKYPTALSGGQKQRVGIARAVATNPKLVILDEPTSALDVSVQARIIDILQEIQESYDITYLFISHDLTVIKNVSNTVGVMYLGKIVEEGPAETMFHNPAHPYTKALVSSILSVSDEDSSLLPDRIILEGEVPDPNDKPTGCSFRNRCSEEFDPCSDSSPPAYALTQDHRTRCYLYDDHGVIET